MFLYYLIYPLLTNKIVSSQGSGRMNSTGTDKK